MNRLEEIKAVFDSQGLVTNADIAALVAALEAALALHKPEGGPSDPACCPICVDELGMFADELGMFAEAYPCPTVTAIQAALGEGEQ